MYESCVSNWRGHRSHLLQPLDVAVFDPLNTQLSNEQRRYVSAGAARLEKWE
jgi:hypothetical protein